MALRTGSPRSSPPIMLVVLSARSDPKYMTVAFRAALEASHSGYTHAPMDSPPVGTMCLLSSASAASSPPVNLSTLFMTSNL